MDMYTGLHLKWITSQDLLYSTENSAQCYISAWMGGEFGEEWIHVYAWLSSLAGHLKLSQHCFLISYTLIQNKKFKKAKNKIFPSPHLLLPHFLFPIALLYFFFFYKIFLCEPVFIEFVTILLPFYVLVIFFGREVCGILGPQPGIEPTPTILKGRVLTAGPPGKSPCFIS